MGNKAPLEDKAQGIPIKNVMIAVTIVAFFLGQFIISMKLATSISKREIEEVETWLGEQVGGFKGQWNVVYLYNQTDFYFKSGDDATFFALRWT